MPRLPALVAVLCLGIGCSPAGVGSGSHPHMPPPAGPDGGLPPGTDSGPSPGTDAGPPPVRPEECNGFDDDGDGMVDEGCPCEEGHTQPCLPGPESAAGLGACRLGVQTCIASGEFSEWGACEGAVGPEPETCGDGIDQDCDGVDPDCEGGDRDRVDTYIYGEDTVSRPVDIVWAVDQSGSMGDEIANVQRNINHLASVIAGSAIDYHVIMVAARSFDPDHHEVCVPPPLAGPGCADSERFRQINQHVDSHDALLQIQLHIGEIEAFMRPGSLRVFIVVSDDESDVPALVADAWLRSRGGYDDYVFDAFVGIDDHVCDDIADEGDTYVQLALLTGGIAEHICTPDWGLALERLATDIVSRTTVFDLSETPVAGSLHVFYVPAPGDEHEQAEGVVWSYDSVRNAVVINEGHTPADGTAIELRYQVAR